MFLKNEDLDILKDIELYLYNKNSETMITEGNNFIIKTENIKDLKALDLYFKLYSLIEKLETTKINKVKIVNDKNKTIYRSRHKLNNKISYLRNKKNKTEEDIKLYEELLQKREKLNDKNSPIKNINAII